jgi:hypothetical protein
MPLPAHLQAVLERIDHAVRRTHRSAQRAHVFQGAQRYAADPETRARTLNRLSIADGGHRQIIAAVKERLALDAVLRCMRAHDPPAPIRRWTLLAVWIGERRLLNETRRVAQRFRPLQLAMAAE